MACCSNLLHAAAESDSAAVFQAIYKLMEDDCDHPECQTTRTVSRRTSAVWTQLLPKSALSMAEPSLAEPLLSSAIVNEQTEIVRVMRTPDPLADLLRSMDNWDKIPGKPSYPGQPLRAI